MTSDEVKLLETRTFRLATKALDELRLSFAEIQWRLIGISRVAFAEQLWKGRQRKSCVNYLV